MLSHHAGLKAGPGAGSPWSGLMKLEKLVWNVVSTAGLKAGPPSLARVRPSGRRLYHFLKLQQAGGERASISDGTDY
jgi:hypothetical protein